MRRLLLGLSIAVASVSLLACSSDDGESEDGDTPATATSAPTEGAGGEQRATEIARFAFETPLEITIGTSVTWTNTEEPHTVTARDGSFNSDRIPQGDSFSHTFATAGTFDYFCEVHPAMEGTVVVD